VTDTPMPVASPARRVPTEFDWIIYADATFAGLALLLPIPFVDGLIEAYFRRRMPGDIARRRGRAPDHGRCPPATPRSARAADGTGPAMLCF